MKNFPKEEGYFYRCKIARSDRGEAEVLEIIEKEKDVHYKKREIVTVWIDPEVKEVPCIAKNAAPDCTEMRPSMQFGELNIDGEWQVSRDVYMTEYLEGYYYKVRFIKTYASDYELTVNKNAKQYSVSDVTTLEKKKG
jgi:hypothetical protein